MATSILPGSDSSFKRAGKCKSVMQEQKSDIYHFFINSDWTNATAIAVLDDDTV